MQNAIYLRTFTLCRTYQRFTCCNEMLKTNWKEGVTVLTVVASLELQLLSNFNVAYMS